MSELSEALMERMGNIVFLENRPFSYLDFIPKFEVNGKEYSVRYGTLRNQFSKLRRRGEIELDYKTKQAFYTIKGHKFGKRKPMTSNHMGGGPVLPNDPIVKLIDGLPTQDNALHDIRLRFSANGFWSTLSANYRYKIDSYSKDIRLQPYKIGELSISGVIHHTDTVSVSICCSSNPIAVDIPGIIRLSNALTRVEERLSRLAEECYKSGSVGNRGSSPPIPEHRNWIVTMWHYGVDGSKEYVGEKFCVTWEVGEHALIRAYSKEMTTGGNKNRRKQKQVRFERQEYPNKTFEEAIEEKLGGF